MSLRRFLVLSVALASSGVFAWGCGERRVAPEPEDQKFGNEAGPPIADPCAGLHCSLDLHSVVTGCDEQLVTTCGAGEGCAAGKCVTACSSAEAAQGSRGCGFMTVPPAIFPESKGSCFAAFVTNTWNEPAEISVSYQGTPRDVSRSLVVPRSEGSSVKYDPLVGPLPPGGVAILFLSQATTSTAMNFVGCPAEAVVKEASGITGTGRFEAFEIKSSVPVSAYSIFPYGGASSFLPSATLLLPLSSWGTGYRLLDAWAATDLQLAPSVQVVASENDTEVKLVPGAAIIGSSGVESAPAGVETTWRLKKGEVVQVVQTGRLIGSPLTATKPVAVFAGGSCMFLPETQQACDSLQQQIPPQTAWGTEYVGVRYRARTGNEEELVPWRVIAAADGTRLRYDPEPPNEAPAELKAGQSAIFWSGRPFTVSSQDADHPIFMNGYMTGGVSYSGVGDPDFVNVVPTDQFLNEYVFFSDYTYGEGTLNLVRTKMGDRFHDVTVDCAGVVQGWKPIGFDGRHEFARVDLVRLGKGQAYATGACGHGRHEAKSTGPFGLTVWGFDTYASYAYPGGSGTRTINTAPIR
jgi:hypothetical protein